MTWESPFSPYTNDLKFPFPYTELPSFPPLETCDLEPLPIRNPATPPAASPNTKGGKGKSHSQLSASSGSHFPWKNVAPYLSVFYGTGLGFLGKKNAFICLGFPIRQPFYCSPPSCIFFPSLKCLQWVLCHFQRRRLPCVQGEKKQDSPGMQPSRRPSGCPAKPVLFAGAFSKEFAPQQNLC